MNDNRNDNLEDVPLELVEPSEDGKDDDDHTPEHANTRDESIVSSSGDPHRIGSIYKHGAGGIQLTSANPLPIDPEEEEEVSWIDVGKACCCHSLSEWLTISAYIAILLGLLYFFLFGLDLLGTSFQVIGGCTASTLLGSDTNPLASVLIGILATAILQSSSTTTSIVVALVGGGLNVQSGIYLVMGANVGTSITCLLVSLAHMGDPNELRQAVAASSLYFWFNFLTLCVLFPLEVTTSYLYVLTKAMLPESVGSGDSWQSKLSYCVCDTNLVVVDGKLGL